TARGVVRSEHSVWIEQDRHAGAFSILYDAKSIRIYRNLKASSLYARLSEPHRESLCLDCHAINARSDHLAPGNQFALPAGVGCEACHGPAEQWIVPHSRPGWRQRPAREKATYGLEDTKDVLVRARKCAGCHVGSAEREVNHDLIAAGHPRLAFEMAGYQA